VILEQGRSTTQIAHELHLSTETVKNHVRHLLRALGVQSRVKAVAAADQHVESVPAGVIVLQAGAEGEWLVTWVPDEPAKQPARSFSSSRGEVPRLESIEEVIAWAKSQPWAH